MPTLAWATTGDCLESIVLWPYRPSGVKKCRHSDSTRICKASAAQMAAIIHPLLTLLASLSRQELAQQVTYLKTENKTLRRKLPDRIRLNNQERRRLVQQPSLPFRT
ncbi:hypothetical protein SH139x_002724 [Planctomycetaceae bacterium SH139]